MTLSDFQKMIQEQQVPPDTPFISPKRKEVIARVREFGGNPAIVFYEVERLRPPDNTGHSCGVEAPIQQNPEMERF